MKKICFIIPSIYISGGINVIFEHAVRLNHRADFVVYVVTADRVDKKELFWHSEAKELNWGTFDDFIEIEFDIVIATWWETCYLATQLNAKAYVYFNQSVESRFYNNEELFKKQYAESTYFLGLNIITEASWIKYYLKDKYDLDAELVLNGIRKDIFKTGGPCIYPRLNDRLRVLVEGPLNVWYKNTERTLELCSKSQADELWLLTNSDITNYPNVDRVISRIPMHKTPEVYRSCDLIVKLSYVEGMFGPPLEMFHCGGTAIVYDVTGHDEYIKNNYNAYVVETDDENKVIELINKLKEDPNELLRLKKNAVETAANWCDWEKASIEFENALKRLCEANHINQAQLRNKTLHFREWYEYYNISTEAGAFNRDRLKAINKARRLLSYKKSSFWAVMKNVDKMLIRIFPSHTFAGVSYLKLKNWLKKRLPVWLAKVMPGSVLENKDTSKQP